MRYESFAHARAHVRRARVGHPRALDGELQGRLVTLCGTLSADSELVAETHVSIDRVLANHRCRTQVHIEAAGERILLEGPLAVAVGSHERKRFVPPHGVVSFRQLRAGILVRARGRLRRMPAAGPMRYRADAGIWALCSTGTTNTVDVASESAPSTAALPNLLQFMAAAWPELPDDEQAPPSTAPEMLDELVRRRRGRSPR
jgi:hypothetical protein